MRSESDSTASTSTAPPTIPGSRSEDGSELKTSNPEMLSSPPVKLCAWCGAPFTKPTAQRQRKARFCDRSCSARWRMSDPERVAKLHTAEVRAKRGDSISAWYASGSPSALANIEQIRRRNPMSDPDVRAKVSRRLRAMGHRPSVRGGNGQGLTLPQSMMLAALGEGWAAEFSVSLGPRTPGYPTHYKLDLAHAERRVGIELDGSSHYSRRALDQKKDAALASRGWTVLRFWNPEILDWIGSGMPTGHSVSTTLASWDIRPSQ